MIDFFNTEQGEGELKDYVSDNEVKSIMVELKQKIEKLKEQQDWKEEQVKRLQERKEEDDRSQKDDVLSRISRQSDGRSVASQKTA